MAHRLVVAHQDEPHTTGLVFLPVEVGLLDRLILPDPVRNATAVWAREARACPHESPRLLIAGSPSSGRATLAHAAASSSGLSLLHVSLDASTLENDLRTARREARWFRASLLLEVPDTKATWSAVWNTVEGTQHPLLVSLPPETAEEGAYAAPFETTLITLEEADATLRGQLWHSMAPRGIALEPEVVATLASSFRFNPWSIPARSVRAAIAPTR